MHTLGEVAAHFASRAVDAVLEEETCCSPGEALVDLDLDLDLGWGHRQPECIEGEAVSIDLGELGHTGVLLVVAEHTERR